MKQILIVLLTFFTLANTAIAQFKLEITPSDSKYASMSIDCQNKANCDKKLLKWIRKQKHFKGDWDKKKKNSIVSKSIKDVENNIVVKYFHPSNFKVKLKDITSALLIKENKRKARKERRKRIKSLSLAKKSNETVAKWRNRVAEAIDEILKDMAE